MRKSQLYILASVLALIALSLFVYKSQRLGFPITPNSRAEIYTVEARVSLRPRNGGNKVNLQILADPPGYRIRDEGFISRNWGENVISRGGRREIQWTVRRASGVQALYYRVSLYRDDEPAAPERLDRLAEPPVLDEPYQTALQGLLDQVRAQSADVLTFVSQLLVQLNDPSPSEEVKLFLKDVRNDRDKADLIVQMLAGARIPARVIQVLRLEGDGVGAGLQPWVQAHNGDRWLTFSVHSQTEGRPRDLLIWSYSGDPVLSADGTRESLEFSVSRSEVDAMVIARDTAEREASALIRYSLLALPLHLRNVYEVLLLVPLGAFVMLVLRNIIGIRTFGTFMPVLIALAFRETKLLGGVVLFVVVVGLGLLARFYLEHLKLLLVPRLTAVLTLTVTLMCLVSIFSHHLGIEIGLSVALFPMVIMAMTIERMSIAWDEKGPMAAIRDAVGSILVAILAYLVMGSEQVSYFVLVFPETLLLLLALTLVIGRYSGYRLTELRRFRALAAEVK